MRVSEIAALRVGTCASAAVDRISESGAKVLRAASLASCPFQ
jgi:hypothetical protein